ncbi:TauD/TfdA family dioxygenase [Amycolatopsis sp. WQ 127309]|uniref:TauD/TfdA family dioxygenase n=1 Tax=Amycolatopsis sp. WQ 127309 TaxID=2932773 RepID=UPI001FF42DD0|nr:TauD/TfdA family dioxygenase [Amycolatopsis sp. WQ 127309]UOZ06978.1 TauD/TfdA family dioxygenase [Amycolatopsis sp. WQ 127309]
MKEASRTSRADIREPSGHTLDLLHRTTSALVAEGVAADSLHAHTHRIPGSLIVALGDLTGTPRSHDGYCVIEGILSGYPDSAGPTPSSWKTADPERTRELDIAFALLAGAAGRPFGWKAQQAGRLVHDIVPSKGSETLQVGASSTVKLEWHTEDSYHPDRPELLLLACVRNPDRVGTDIASVRQADLTDEDIAALSTTPVLLYPDDSYPGSWSDTDDPARMLTLWETTDGLCMRFDPPYTKLPDAQPALRSAWERLGEALDRCATTVTADPGDVVVVNNDVAAHARRPFKARYDGTDRWLKRILARSTHVRPETERHEPGYHQVQVGPYPSLFADR